MKDLPRVAVVDLEDGGAPLRLDAHALEAEILLLRAFVDALRVVVQHEQAVGGGVHHLHHQAQPFGREVVAFVNEHGLVLPAGDLAAVHAGDDALDHVFKEGIPRQVLRGQVLPVGHQLLTAPFVEVHSVHAVGNAFGGHHPSNLPGQRFVVAEDEDGFAGRGLGLGQMLGAVAQQHGLT